MRSLTRQVLYCQAEDKPVSRSELVRGFEYEKDCYVVVDQNELDQIAPPSRLQCPGHDGLQTLENSRSHVRNGGPGLRPWAVRIGALR